MNLIRMERRETRARVEASDGRSSTGANSGDRWTVRKAGAAILTACLTFWASVLALAVWLA